MLEDDSRLYEAEATLLCMVAAALGLALLARVVRGKWPDLDLRLVLGVAFGLRVAVVLAQGLLGSTGETLRGTDDAVSQLNANVLAETPITDELWRNIAGGDLHLAFFGAQTWLLGGPGGTPLRVVQAALAVAAIGLMAVAVNRLAGRYAALAAAWFVAVEPTSVLFTTLLHKESLVFLGEGLFLVGVAACWTRRTLHGLPALLGGAALVALVRPYAGVFLFAAGAAVTGYLVATGLGPERRRSALGIAAVAIALLGGVAAASTRDPLGRAQSLQDEEPTLKDNLQLEPVDFTTVGGFARGLPERMGDFLLRPYPWQAANLSQRLGVAGTLIAWSLYLLLVYSLATSGRAAIARAGPLLFTSGVLTVCYALSTANAGAGYRHRIHLLLVLAAALAVLLADRLPAWSRVTAGLGGARRAAAS